MSSKQEYYARLSEMTDRACDIIDEMFDSLGIKYFKGRQYICGPCPIHQGNNQQAWVFYPEGHTARGIWHCYTRGCHSKGKNLVNLIQGILNTQNNHEVTFNMAVEWIVKFLGYESIHEIPLPDQFVLDKRRQHTRDYYFSRIQQTDSGGTNSKLTRWQARDKLQLPSQYYVGRGYSKKILDRYDVGEAGNRVVVPVYDIDYKYIIGSTSRSLYPQCNKCHLWHDPKESCPLDKDFGAKVRACKWFNNNFEKSESLYNLWHESTKTAIANRGRLILVEGPGDVWRLEEAGIHNSVALYGVELSDSQIMLLYEHYVNEIAFLIDADSAGKHATELLAERLKKEFNFRWGKLPVGESTTSPKDVGEIEAMNISNIQLINYKKRPCMTIKEYSQ